MDENLGMLLGILALGLATLLIVAALLIQFGCFVTGAEVPSFGRAFAVNLLNMVVGTVVNFGIVLGVGYTMETWGEDAANNTTLAWGVRGAICVSNVFVLGLIAMACLNKVNAWRGVVIGLILSFGMFGLGIAAAFTLGSMIAFQR